MQAGSRKEKVREGVRISDQFWKRKDIAEAWGIAPQTLSTFMSGGTLSESLLDKAEAWLRENNYWPGNSASPEKSDMASVIASDLRACADFLEAPQIPNELKAQRFAGLIEGYAQGIQRYRKLLEQRDSQQ